MRRRDFIHCSLCATGGWLLGCDAHAPADAGPDDTDAGRDGGFDGATLDAGGARSTR